MGRNGTRMMHEIMEQPRSIERTLDSHRKRVAAFAKFMLKENVTAMDAVGSGSSLHAALIGKNAVSGISLRVCEPSSYEPRSGVALFVSQSGESADILDAVSRAKGRGRFAVAITNNWMSPLASLSDMVIPTFAEEEKCVPATGTMLSAMLTFFSLEAELWPKDEKRKELDGIPFRLSQLLMNGEVLDAAARFAHETRAVALAAFLGGGKYRHAASEMALKVAETAEIIAVHECPSMFMHGKLAPFVAGTPPVSELGKAIFTISSSREGSMGLPKGENLGTYRIFHDKGSGAEDSVELDARNSVEQAVFPIVFGQLLAHGLALEKGMEPGISNSLPKIVR